MEIRSSKQLGEASSSNRFANLAMLEEEIETEIVPETGWEYYVSADGSLSAQYEHTIAITKDGPKILTSQDPEFDAKYRLK